MRVLLEGSRLAQTHDFGGVDSYWQQLVPRLLARRPEDTRVALLTACLDPRYLRVFRRYARAGADLRHWWLRPGWMAAAGRAGMRTGTFAGPYDLLHIAEPAWDLAEDRPVVVTAHDLMYVDSPQYLAPQWVDRLMRGTQRLAHQAAFWICVSAHTRDRLCQEFGVPAGRTAVVHHGVDPRFHGAAQREEEQRAVRERMGLGERPYFLFLGSVEPKKNLALLLDAYGRAAADGMEADLVVAGRAGWGAEEVRAAAARHPALEERMRFPGFVDADDLPGLVAGARAMVLPSRYEGFGMPVVEAMAAGTPVLCSDRGALPEVAGGAALHFDADDVDALSGLLAQVDSDPALCQTLRERGLARAAAFDWDDCADRTWQAYRAALALPR